MAEPGPNASTGDLKTGSHAPGPEIHLETTTAEDALMTNAGAEDASESPAQAADAADTDNTRPWLPCRTPSEFARWHAFMNRRLPVELHVGFEVMGLGGVMRPQYFSRHGIISYATYEDIPRVVVFQKEMGYNAGRGEKYGE